MDQSTIHAMCERAFGTEVRVSEARQISGGKFNTTYLVQLDDRPVILRIAPAADAGLSWDEVGLMRREHQIQPYFAAIAALMPRTLLVDFTHRLIDRDYIIQSYLPGERWDEVNDEFTPEEQLPLWEQFGRITRAIHDTTGNVFGGPSPAPEFGRWSEAVLYRLEQTIAAMHGAQLDPAPLQTVLEAARRQPERLDELQTPHLLHGDLWLFNILVQRGAAGPAISGILDADRAWWGDPLADWTMFVLAKSAGESTQPFHAAFWRGYGPIDPLVDTSFRRTVYEAMHIGTAMAWAARNNDEDTVQRGRRELGALAERF